MKKLIADIRFGRTRTKIAFLHIPKCAGTSVNWHLKKHLGSARSGRAVMLNAIEMKMSGQRPTPEQIRAAPFVAGHCGWEDIAGLANTHFRFTVLRKPVERTLSFYDFCRSLPSEKSAPHFPIRAAQTLSFEEFCSADDPAIRMFVDNVQARTLARSYLSLYDDLPEDWQSIARTNLTALDFVAISEKLDAHLPALCRRTGLPTPKQSVKRNVRSATNANLPSLERAHDILAERISADQRLYELGLELAERT